MTIEYIGGKPFSTNDGLPVDHPRCCGECYLWCDLRKIDEEQRDTALALDQRNHVITRTKFIDPKRAALYDDPIFKDLGTPYQLVVESYRECTYCYERPELERVGDVVQTATECPAPDGVFTEYEVVFPSGKIVVDDSLHDVVQVDINQYADYNTDYGQREVVLAYAEQNVAYGPVGNTCPGVYRTAPDKYQIANPAYDENDEPAELSGENLAGVCTDLWAYSIMDYDEYVARGGSTDMSWTRTVVDIGPGRYRFRHHTGERVFDRDATDGPIIYADFEWVASS